MWNKYYISGLLMLFISSGLSLNTANAAQEKRPAKDNSTTGSYDDQQYKDRIVAMDLEYRALKKAYEELNSRYNDLKFENGQLSWQIKELSAWNRKLHAGYGPGIWLMSDSDTPEFKYKSQSGKVEEVIQDLNVVFRDKKYPQVIFKKLENNTAIISLDKPGLLTKKMGATGAAYYLKEVLYTVTSADEVDCIYLDLPDADTAESKKTCR